MPWFPLLQYAVWFVMHRVLLSPTQPLRHNDSNLPQGYLKAFNTTSAAVKRTVTGVLCSIIFTRDAGNYGCGQMVLRRKCRNSSKQIPTSSSPLNLENNLPVT